MFAGGLLSVPRDFSSPPSTIQITDQSGAPIDGVEVSRNWDDSDCDKMGSEMVKTDEAGNARFAKVPAKVGLFTGTLRKTSTCLGSCASGSGTATHIFVRYPGRYNVVPKDKTLRPMGHSFQDSDGVIFYVGTDSLSNTTVQLTFYKKIKDFSYVLVSSKNRGP